MPDADTKGIEKAQGRFANRKTKTKTPDRLLDAC